MTIEVVHTCTEETRQGPRTTRETLLTGPLTPRRLAAAVKMADEQRDYFRKAFGPMAVSPRHSVRVLIDGDASLEDYVLSLRYCNKLTWTAIVKRIK